MTPSAPRRLVAQTAISVVAALALAAPAGAAPASDAPVRDAVRSVVGIETAGGWGTGFVTAGGVVTAAHVVAGASRVAVVVGRQRLQGEVARVDEFLDLALLEVDVAHLAPLALDDAPELGEPVTVVAYDPVDGPVLSRGIVSALPVESGVELVQTDAAVDPGSSGGPVLGADGRVLGLVITEDVFRDDVGHAHTAGDVADFLAARGSDEGRQPVADWRDGEPIVPGSRMSPLATASVAGAVVALAGVGMLRSRTPRRRDELSIQLGPVTVVEDPERPPT